MTTKSSIEWTELTWNPVVGCTKISPGCKNCYAETMARRLQAMGMRGYENGFKLTLMPERLHEPLARSKPAVYFVNSMSDLFHEKVPFEYIQRVFDVMGRARQHTFQVLTKRAERMAELCGGVTVPENVWLGVSVENRKHGFPRIRLLQGVTARVRFLSIEPLLEDLGSFDLTGISWVIVGGESGHRARPMKPVWIDGIKRQCDAAGVAFFFKQWGTWGADGERRSKAANGREYRGQVWDAMPQLA
ncbi:MAG: phage Gp37/Gp68 family protein [Betaproteobacteria bacterium]|nr:phage Gp37/Gp68 family protein [Betaproteobacteria bacterium]